MKKLLSYIFVFLAVTACSTEDIVTTPDTETDVTTEAEGIKVEIEAPVGLGDADISRSTIVYDDDKNIMAFKWSDYDCIGVFTYPDAAHSQEQKFRQYPDPATDSDLLRTFETEDHKLNVEPGKEYVACLPYFENHMFDYTNIEVSYTRQCQADPVDFTDYKQTPDPKYKTSQPKASAHLSKYDYLCSGPTISSSTGRIRFKMDHMGAIVRFWIVIDPKYNYVYDELQLVNSAKEFTTEATMNVATKELTPTKTSHMVTLQLGKDGQGFDTSNVSESETSSTFYYWNNTKHMGYIYIMAYMMLAPIDLTNVENCVLYLVAHEKGEPGIKHYFKATGLSKPNLKPNTFYKWTVYPDEAIEVSSITVEEWRKGTTFYNGDNGAGTGSW